MSEEAVLGPGYAIVRITSFDETKLAESAPLLEAFQRTHSSQPGYAGTIEVDLGGGRRLVVNLWESDDDARAALATLRDVVGRTLGPAMTDSQLIGAGPVTGTDIALDHAMKG